jgi:acyl dehydratase
VASLKLTEFQENVGREIGVSRWFPIGQARIDGFADLTEDRQGIHVDTASAAQSAFGATIAHGFLVLSLLSAMAAEVLPPFDDRAFSMNYGFDKVRFVSPVRAGARVRGRFTLAAASARANGDQLNRFSVTVEIEGETKPALIAEWLTLDRPVNV